MHERGCQCLQRPKVPPLRLDEFEMMLKVSSLACVIGRLASAQFFDRAVEYEVCVGERERSACHQRPIERDQLGQRLVIGETVCPAIPERLKNIAI